MLVDEEVQEDLDEKIQHTLAEREVHQALTKESPREP